MLNLHSKTFIGSGPDKNSYFRSQNVKEKYLLSQELNFFFKKIIMFFKNSALLCRFHNCKLDLVQNAPKIV